VIRSITTVLIVGVITCISGSVKGQASELAQLALNIEKLAQFKQILSDLQKGYEILSGGYNTIKSLSKGNFELHKVFLDGLSEVSPAVKNYHRVAGIIDLQIKLMHENNVSLRRLRTGGRLLPSEITYVSNVYDGLLVESLKNIEDLLTIITAAKLRMSDDERLDAIDQLYASIEDKLVFARSFNAQASMLSFQRSRGLSETKRLRQSYGLE
jgi:archaellum component FlaC